MTSAVRSVNVVAWTLALAIRQGQSATFHGYVNPLSHYNEEKNAVFAFNLPDAETTEQLTEAVQTFQHNWEKYQLTVESLSRGRIGQERCDTTQDTQNMWPHMEKLQAAGYALSRKYVNIGANDGKVDDPLYEYAWRTNASGVAVERDEENCRRHKENLPSVDVVCSEVTPQNAAMLIGDGLDLDILKVDIDSYDCPVLESLLQVTSAKLVLVEANPSIPPPYKWAMLYHPGLWPFFWGFKRPEAVPIRGCSLAFEIDLLRQYGFDFLAFGGHDAVFVHRSVRDAWLPQQLPMDEFDCYNDAFIAANGISIAQTRRWFYEVNDTHAGLQEIWDFFTGWMLENAGQTFPFSLRT
eukprot:TRINITY_DN114180_c0_g1_i1.p1 TRINITY_DN114180_c0_g1~~TRINITY_DN114180_c0_g1_i1.p1  ORF type:complete len:353 (-),score=63.13 TRINITY_DN114180_c0_g1_i1:347-1405(-)